VDANILAFQLSVEVSCSYDFATNTRQPPSQDIAGDKEEVHSRQNKDVDGFRVARTRGTTRRTQRFKRRGLNV
jgi:hypothetical protein